MKVFDVGPQDGLAVEAWGSREFVVTSVVDADAVADPRIHVCYLGQNGLIGAHPTGVDQLFLVVSGTGRVHGQDGAPVPIAAGQAALWEAGEEHHTETDTSLSAVIVQWHRLQQLLTEAGPGPGA